MYEVPLFSEAECSTLVKAVEVAMASPGFVPTRRRFDSETEVPLGDLSSEVCNPGTIPVLGRNISHTCHI